MAFIHKTYCEDCGEEVQDIFKHGPEVCSESPENRKKREIANAAWQENFDRLTNAWNAWQEDTGELKHAYPSVEYTPHEIAFKGKCVLVYMTDYEGEMNEDEDNVYRNFESPVLENPTWGDIARQFDEAIPTVGDYHHSFLEGIRKATKETLPVAILNFCTGS